MLYLMTATRLTLFAAMLLWVAFACSLPEPTPTPEPTSTPTAPTAPPAPTATPQPEPTPTPEPTPEPTPTPSGQPTRGLFEYIRAVAYLEANLWEEAIPAYGLVIRIIPDMAVAYHGRGYAYYNEAIQEENDNLFKPAMEDYDKAIELKPGFARAYQDRAILHHRLGHTDAAIDDLESAVRFYDPRRQPVRLNEARELLNEWRR